MVNHRLWYASNVISTPTSYNKILLMLGAIKNAHCLSRGGQRACVFSTVVEFEEDCRKTRGNVCVLLSLLSCCIISLATQHLVLPSVYLLKSVRSRKKNACPEHRNSQKENCINPLSTDGHYSGHLAKLNFFCRISKFNTCTLTTCILILKNLHHWFVFISDFRTYQVFSGPCISQCIAFNWKALMLISPHFS